MSTSMAKLAVILATAAVTLAGSLTGGLTRTASTSNPYDIDLLSSALSTDAHPVVNDRAIDSARSSRARAVKIDTGAVSSAECPSCKSTATTLHVIRLNRVLSLKADNVAVAGASCGQGCEAASVSVQIVLARNARSVIVNNRAAALNVACSDCTSKATAIQIVIVGGRDRISPAARAALEKEIAELTADSQRMQASRSARTKSADDSSEQFYDRASRILTADTGGKVGQHSVHTQTR